MSLRLSGKNEKITPRGRLGGVLQHPHFLLCCIFLFVAIRLSLVIFVPLAQSSDAAWYFNEAVSIASGQGYAEGGYPTAYWPVGYPGFLGVLFALFGSHQMVGQLANVALGAGTLLLLYGLTKRIFQDEMVARVALVLFTLYPNNAAYAPLLFTETYVTFLLLLGAYLFISREGRYWVLVTGLVFGLAALTKPQFVLVPALLIALRLMAPDGWRDRNRIVLGAVCLYGVMASVLVPWAVRNTLTFGEVVLISTNGGATLLTGNNPSARGDYNQDDPLVAQIGFSVKDQVAADKRARELAHEWIKANPGRFLALIPLKIWRLWAPDGEAEWMYQAGAPDYERYRPIFRIVRWANQVFYVCLIAAFLGSLAIASRMRTSTFWPFSWFPYVLAVFLTVISAVFSGQSRFHFPAMPWVIMTAAWLLCRVLEMRNPGKRAIHRSAQAADG